jgi:opacity protein-like surface antigen
MMTRICRYLVIFNLVMFLLLTTVPMASAQQQAGPFYMGVFGGFVIPDKLHVDDYGYGSYYYEGRRHGRDWRDISLDNSWTAGAKGGYIIPQLNWMAVELEYTCLGKQNFNDSRINGEFSANNVTANLLFRYPRGRIHPYGGFGLGISIGSIKVDSLVDYDGIIHSNVVDKNQTALAGQFIGGVNFEITANWSAELSYKFIYSKYNTNNDFGDVETYNNLLTLGISYRF